MVISAQAGDRVATAKLLASVWPAGFRIARSVVSEPAAAEDVTQEACARALSALPTLRSPDRFAPWFYRIVANEARQRLRLIAREASLDEDVEHNSIFNETALEDRLDVRAAIETLEPALRATILLRYDGGLNSREIGAALGTSAVTARWRLMIAQRKLRAALQPERSLTARVAVPIAIILAAILVAANVPAVVAGVERALRAFDVRDGRLHATTVHVIDLQGARNDAPFSIIAPPALAGTRATIISEIAGSGSKTPVKIVFQVRRAHRPDVTIVESAAPTAAEQTMLTTDGSPIAPDEVPKTAHPGRPSLVLCVDANGTHFLPEIWRTHGTLVVLISPPGALTPSEARRIRQAMSSHN